MRNLGAFFGHVARAIRSDPAKKRITVSKIVEEEDRGNITLRRTTIDEVEFKHSPESKTDN